MASGGGPLPSVPRYPLGSGPYKFRQPAPPPGLMGFGKGAVKGITGVSPILSRPSIMTRSQQKAMMAHISKAKI
jgi:hypothetical protein